MKRKTMSSRIISGVLCLILLIVGGTNGVAQDMSCAHMDSVWAEEVAPTARECGLQVRRCSGCSAALEWLITDPAYDAQLTDVDESRWYMDAVRFVVSNDLFRGVSDAEFSPDGAMTRAMAVTVLHRFSGMAGLPIQGKQFSDVESERWYSKAIAWASNGSVGLVNGITDTKFNPDGVITREQFAVMLYRYATYYNADTTNDRAVLTDYQDATAVSAYAQDAMSWAVARGILQGVDGNTLAPQGFCTRAQAAELLHLLGEKMYDVRTPKLIVNGKDITDGNCVAINYAKRYALLPLEAIVTELGGTVEKIGENKVLVWNYAVDLRTGQIEGVSVDGARTEWVCQEANGQVLVGSDTIALLLGGKLTIDYNTSEVRIDS